MWPCHNWSESFNTFLGVDSFQHTRMAVAYACWNFVFELGNNNKNSSAPVGECDGFFSVLVWRYVRSVRFPNQFWRVEPFSYAKIFSCSAGSRDWDKGDPVSLHLHVFFSFGVFSLTCPASMQISWNKRKRLHKKRVQLPDNCFGTPIWPNKLLTN